MHYKIFWKYFLPALFGSLLAVLFFYRSPFSGEAFLLGLGSAVYIIGLGLLLDERTIIELPKSGLFSIHQLAYSFSLFAALVTVTSLAVDRILFLLKFLGIGYSPRVSLVLLFVGWIGGYSCLAYLVWFISVRKPSGVSAQNFLKENSVRLVSAFLLILGVSCLIILPLSQHLTGLIARPGVRRAVFAVMILFLLMNIDFSKIQFRSLPAVPLKPKADRLFLVGIDAADWKIVGPLLRKGKLPNLTAVLENAAYGYLDSYGERLSPVLWTSFITGATADVHGIKGFVFHPPGKKEATLYKSYHRKVPALWHILSSAGRRVGVLNWLLSYPAEKTNGYMVSRVAPEAYAGLAYPENLYPRILPLACFPKPDATVSCEQRDLDEISGELRTLEKVAVHLLREHPTEAFIFYTQTTDKVMHKFWHYRQPRKFKAKAWNLRPTEIDKFGEAIDDHWCQLDAMLGKILPPRDERTNIVIVSDHGVKGRAKPFLYAEGNKILESLGFLKFREETDDVDFTLTKVYCSDPTIWNTFYSFSLNVKGREENGIVEGNAFAGERKRIIDQLQGVRTKTGKSLFGAVYAVEEKGTDIIAEHTSLLRESSEEILITNNQEIPLKRLLRRVAGDSGNHDPRGAIIMAGPAFAKRIISRRVIEFAVAFVLSYFQGLSQNKIILRFYEVMKRVNFIDPYTTLDLLPTLLATMGLPSTDYMPGKIMIKPLSAEGRRTLNFQKINQYDIPLSPALGEEREDLEERKIKDQLRGLGYLG